MTIEKPPELLEIDQVSVWGVPFSRVTFEQTVAAIDRLIANGQPHFVVTANLHYAMLAAQDARLRAYTDRAALVLADGMPIVWASKWRTKTLPERVTGSDLFPMLCAHAAERGYGIYLLGAAPGVADDAATRLRERHPTLRIVGVQSPPFRESTQAEQEALADDIRRAKPDMLFVAFGQPKGEYWVADWYEKLGVPVVMQVGASIDFAAERVHRAPKWMQRIGMEWAYRFWREPFRLGGRYAANAWFAIKMLMKDAFTRKANRK